MTLFGVVQLINSITLFLMSILLIKNNPKNLTNRNLAWAMTCISLWCFFYFIWQTSDDYYVAEFWLRILMFWVIFIPVFFFRFILYFLDIFESKKKVLYIVYLGAIFFAAGTLMGYLNNGLQDNMYLKFSAKAGPLFRPMIFYFGSVILYSLYLLLRNYKEASPITRQQIKYIFFGVFFAYLINTTNYALWFDINIPPVGNFFLIFFFIFIGYSLVANHLVQIGLVFRKPTIHFFSFLTLVVASLFLNYLGYIFFTKSLILFNILITILVAHNYSKVKHFTYKTANKYFFTSFYDSTKLIEHISEELSSTLNLNAIYRIIDDSMTKTFHCKAISILLYDEKKEQYYANYSRGFIKKNKRIFGLSNKFNKQVSAHKKPIIIEELKKNKIGIIPKEIMKDIEDYGIEVISLMYLKHRVIGMIVLGGKISGDIYNDVDLKVLKTVSEQAALSIENAILYKEVTEFNRTLQQKVDFQTKELKEKAEHLKKLMEMRSEFLDIASHQLRTPVSVIKGVLSMIEEGSIPEDKKKVFINGALEKSIKLGEIINDILRASEMDSEKFILHNKPARLEDLLKKINEDKKRSAEIKKINFILKMPDQPLPKVYADERYLEHAIVNLINNAIQYTLKGTVEVSANVENDEVVIRVADTGIGIPKENLGKLFQKFSRAENAIEAYADGSGLGLFIVKQVIDGIPGARIEVEKTELKRGTTFAIYLPIFQEAAVAVV